MASTSDQSTSLSLREWYPIESSPEVFTQLAKQWGVDDRYTFQDVYSLDPEYLETIPKTCHAVIFLFPDTPEIVEMRTKEECIPPEGSDIVWIPQTTEAGHSCGTFALVHALGVTGLSPILQPFFEQCRQTPVQDRTALFAGNKHIYNAHHSVITAGQTAVRDTDWEDADHFLSFVHADVEGEKRVVEMDGNPPRTGPLDRGPASGDLLQDVSRIIRERYLPNASGNLHFSVMALIG